MIGSISTKQKFNARISTNSEIIGVDNIIINILWTHKFWKCQGIEVKANIIYQDNTITMKLQKNGEDSPGKRT